MATIKERRELQGLTQEQMATIVGVHVQTLSRWERGQIPEQWRQLIRLARRLGCRPEELVPEE